MKRNVGYDPEQKMRDQLVTNTEVQYGYAPGLGAFGVSIVKPRRLVQPDLKANFLRLKRLANKMDKGGE